MCEILGDGSCKFFREDLVCEILFDYGVWMQEQIQVGGGSGSNFFHKYCKKNE